MTEPREVPDQLDLFRQPAEPQSAMEYIAAVTEEAYAELRSREARKTQMTELAGETWEDAFGDAA